MNHWAVFKGAGATPLKQFRLKRTAMKWAERYVHSRLRFTRVILAWIDGIDLQVFDKMYFDRNEGWTRV